MGGTDVSTIRRAIRCYKETRMEVSTVLNECAAFERGVSIAKVCDHHTSENQTVTSIDKISKLIDDTVREIDKQ